MSTHTITVFGFTAIAIALIALMQTRITRLLILLLWGWLGWHFFAR
jgi:hypothetical protein